MWRLGSLHEWISRLRNYHDLNKAATAASNISTSSRTISLLLFIFITPVNTWQSSSQKAESKNARLWFRNARHNFAIWKEGESIKYQHCASKCLPPHDRKTLIWGGHKRGLYLIKHASVESKCRASKLQPVPTSTPPFPFLKLCQELLNWITCEKKASDRAFLNVLVNSSDTAILQPDSENTIAFLTPAGQILYWLLWIRNYSKPCRLVDCDAVPRNH